MLNLVRPNEKVFKKKSFAFGMILCTITTKDNQNVILTFFSEFQEAAFQSEKPQKQSQVSI